MSSINLMFNCNFDIVNTCSIHIFVGADVGTRSNWRGTLTEAGESGRSQQVNDKGMRRSRGAEVARWF